MQYFKPAGDHLFAGDCMPFFHHGTFHLYYLLDEDHHAARDGLGGHQWAHASTTDLIHWTHHPLAIPLTQAWEGSICTGSIIYDNGLYSGFYATRLRDRTEHLSLATSQDGVQFQKTDPNPFASSPPGYDPHHYRDPTVFRDARTGLYHLLMTARRDDAPIYNRGGCLGHLVSWDLANWEMQTPFLVSGLSGAPECPDYFFWKGWYYLLFSHDGRTHYRMSSTPFGPWRRPLVDTFDGAATRVMKTAAFTEERRIGVAWIGTREGHSDAGRWQFGGHVVFREIIQGEDGTLGTRFPAEMMPPASASLSVAPVPMTAQATAGARQVRLHAGEELEVAMVEGVPSAARIRATVRPEAGAVLFGLCLKGVGNLQSGYELRFLPFERRVELFDQTISCVDGLDDPFEVEVILKEDIVDVCIGRRRCLITRGPGLWGDRLFFFAHHAEVVFDGIDIRPLHPAPEA